MIIEALRAASGRIAGKGGAAERLGLKRTTLQNKIRRLGIAKARLPKLFETELASFAEAGFRVALEALKCDKGVGAKALSEKKDRERVTAEITLSHLIRLGNEQGRPVSREQAIAFLNQEGRAFEMWKHMMQAAEEFIAGSLFQHSFAPRGHNGFASQPGTERSISTAAQ